MHLILYIHRKRNVSKSLIYFIIYNERLGELEISKLYKIHERFSLRYKPLFDSQDWMLEKKNNIEQRYLINENTWSLVKHKCSLKSAKLPVYKSMLLPLGYMEVMGEYVRQKNKDKLSVMGMGY